MLPFSACDLYQDITNFKRSSLCFDKGQTLAVTHWICAETNAALSYSFGMKLWGGFFKVTCFSAGFAVYYTELFSPMYLLPSCVWRVMCTHCFLVVFFHQRMFYQLRFMLWGVSFFSSCVLFSLYKWINQIAVRICRPYALFSTDERWKFFILTNTTWTALSYSN